MTLLELVQSFCQRTGLAVPTLAVGNTDPQVIQLIALLNEVVEDIVIRRPSGWTTLQLEATFTTLAAEDQGLLTTLAPYGFISIINDTIFNRTQRLPGFGPTSPQTWQYMKASGLTGPFNNYRIKEGRLFLYPAPPAGQTYAFEYLSTYAVSATNGTTFKPYFTVDTDYFRLNEVLLLRGLRWKWKKEKGFEYDEERDEYETYLAELMGKDGTRPKLSMSQGTPTIQPGIFVPSGNWNQ